MDVYQLSKWDTQRHIHAGYESSNDPTYIILGFQQYLAMLMILLNWSKCDPDERHDVNDNYWGH